MNTRNDLGDLRRQWQQQPASTLDVATLHRQVEFESQAHNRALIITAVLTVLVLIVMLVRALRLGSGEAWFGAIWTGIFAAIVWPVSIWLSRGTWRPRDESTAAHLDLSIRRCKAVLVAAPVGIVLYLLGLLGALLWRHRLFGGEWSELLSTGAVIIAGWIGAPLYAGGMLWYASRQRRRLGVLEALKRQLGEV